MITVKYRERTDETIKRMKQEKKEKIDAIVKVITTISYCMILVNLLLIVCFTKNIDLSNIYISIGLVFVLALVNSFFRGLTKTILLPVGYGIGALLLVAATFIFMSSVGGDMDYNAITDYRIWILWGSAGAVPTFVGVILGSLLGIGYRRDYIK